MRYNFIAGSALALASGTLALTNGCSDAAEDASGNYYCEPAVGTLKYTGVGGSGTYQKVTEIDSSDACTYAEQAYSGNLAPYDEEIAVVFRGPLKLRQFAAYSYDSDYDSKVKREAKRTHRPSPHERRHAHGHAHFHENQKEVRAIQEKAEAEKRAVGDIVTATIDGQVVTWTNTYSGATAAADAVSAATAAATGNDWITATINGEVVSWLNNIPGATAVAGAASSALDAVGVKVEVGATTTAASAASETASSTSSSAESTATGPWKRISYFNSEENTQDGLVFLTHPAYTNTIAFADTDGVSQASDSTTFGGELDNADEMFIMTDSPCSEDIGTDCAYFKDGDEAYHGFGGTKKAFFFEFSMPDSGTHCSVDEMEDKYTADNMPAIWTLNAKIMTNQYGCSCWTSGCGELDFLEVLNPGNSRMKSTFHGNSGFNGGDSHYIERPFDYYMSAIAVFQEDTFVIKVLNNGTEAPSSLSQDYIDEIIGDDDDTLENILGELAVFVMSLYD